MDVSIICSVEKTGFPEFVFDGDIEFSFPFVRKLGYKGVELALSNPKSVDLDYLRELLKENNLKVANIGTGEISSLGFTLTSLDETIRNKCIEKIKEFIDFSSVIGGSISIGCVRGPKPGEGFTENQKKWLEEGIRNVNYYAIENQVKLLLEPLSAKYSASINLISEGIELLSKIGSNNIKLLVDFYHLWLNGEDIADSIIANKDFIGHIHIADSNREYPGSGEINFAPVFQALRDIGYDGFVSLEGFPKPTPIECATKTIEFIMKYI